ncbi:hypothetical protein ACG83_30795 [Frankia sp. R43]|nr:hypothetical protein ACG83_30795 [Frankia sp. R43]
MLDLQVAPGAGPQRDQLARALIGRNAVDGLGGGTPVTNKVVLVGAGSVPGAELDFIVGNVSGDGGTVDWSGTCGNMTSAVVPFAAVTGLLDLSRRRGPIRLRNLATDGLVDVALPGGGLKLGEVGTEIKLTTSFLDPGGLVLGSTLPTGRARDTVEVDNETFDFSLIDVTHPYLFLFHAQVIGDRSLDAPATAARVESIRGAVCVRLGLCAHRDEAAASFAAVPRVVLLHPEPESSVNPRIIAVSMGQFIASVPVTAALSLAAARMMHGTIVGGGPLGGSDEAVVHGLSGSVTAAADVDHDGRVRSVSVERTARVLMRGHITV